MPVDAYAEKFDFAVMLFDSGQAGEAKRLCDQLLLERPGDAKVLGLLGIILAQQGDLVSAIEPLRQAAEADLHNPSALSNYGNILKDLGQLDLAIIQYQKAVAADPKFADAYYNLGIAQGLRGFHLEAIGSFDAALQLRPNQAQYYLNRGNTYQVLRNLDAALLDYNRVIALQPDSIQGYVNRANLRHPALGDKGVQSDFETALRLEPNSPEALHNFAQYLHASNRYEQAVKILEKLYEVFPDLALCDLLHCKSLIASWPQWDELLFELRVRLAYQQAVARPFGLMGMLHSETELLTGARNFKKRKFPIRTGLIGAHPHSPRSKIRIGYLAGEFRQHATSILMTGVFESHDRNRFEVYAFDNGWDDGSELRQRQNAAFHKIIDISKVGDLEAARMIAENEIDILIDLNGFFGAARQGVFAFKPSPVQVSYLGCPGTMGAEYFDYLIADSSVIPAASEIFYDEKIVRLPHTYQANDSRRKVSGRAFTRAEAGLPAEGFVFCCFNNNYKILPDTFSQWMRILQKVEGSVLWLFVINQDTVLHLRREAEKRGVHPDRLIFAPPIPPPDHLARHRLADLFLDTLPYNAHTTASDALWMGLPLVTQVGTTFPGRVAASLLSALGVPELITRSPEAYEALAVDLATAPTKLKAIREKIISQRATAPLFNTKLFTQHFEQALEAMYQRHQSGLPPAAITIKP